MANFAAPTLNRTSSLVATGSVSHGEVVYKDDVLQNPTTGLSLTVANGYNNDFTFSDSASFTGVSMTAGGISNGTVT